MICLDSKDQHRRWGHGGDAVLGRAIAIHPYHPHFRLEILFEKHAAVTYRDSPRDEGIAGTIEGDEGFVLWSWDRQGRAPAAADKVVWSIW